MACFQTNFWRLGRLTLAFGALILTVGCGGSLASIIPDVRKTPQGNIEIYRLSLAARLQEKYNNDPEWAGKIGRVEVNVAKRMISSTNKKRVRVEFDQLVYDEWGERISQLEEEYFIVTFGDTMPRMVRVDPSINIGLDAGTGFSEHYPRVGLQPTVEPTPFLKHIPAPPQMNERHDTRTRDTAPHRPASDALPIVSAEPDDLMPTRVQPPVIQGMGVPYIENGQGLPRAHMRRLSHEPQLGQ